MFSPSDMLSQMETLKENNADCQFEEQSLMTPSASYMSMRDVSMDLPENFMRDDRLDREKPTHNLSMKFKRSSMKGVWEVIRSPIYSQYGSNRLSDDVRMEFSTRKEQEQERVIKSKTPAYIHKGRTAKPCEVILDPDTAHCNLILSDDMRQVSCCETEKDDIDDQHRFTYLPGVLASEGFDAGRHFWHVAVNKHWTIGVTRDSTKRQGSFSISMVHGYWCLEKHFYLSVLEKNKIFLDVPVPEVLGVCVDVDEKWVSFYNAVSKAVIYTWTDMNFNEGERIYPVFFTSDKKELKMLDEM